MPVSNLVKSHENIYIYTISCGLGFFPWNPDLSISKVSISMLFPYPDHSTRSWGLTNESVQCAVSAWFTYQNIEKVIIMPFSECVDQHVWVWKVCAVKKNLQKATCLYHLILVALMQRCLKWPNKNQNAYRNCIFRSWWPIVMTLRLPCVVFWTFSSSSQEPLGQFQPNLVGSINRGWQFKFVKIKGLGALGDLKGAKKG